MIHNTPSAELGMLAFLAVYVVTNLGAFAGIIALADATGKENIRDFDGFGRRSPWIAFGMGLCLLSLAGAPPMAGFFTKLFILLAACSQGCGLTLLVVLALITSAISIVFYVHTL